MSADWPSREREIIEQLRARFTARGYTVEAPTPADVGGDLLARREDETVLIEVTRVARRSESDADKLKTLARLAASRGWRFSIVVVNDATVEEVDVLTPEAVLQLIRDASGVEATSWIAAVAAVAAFEAAARYALAQVGRGSIGKAGALGYLQVLAMEGFITPEDEQAIQRVLQVRNAAAHGLAVGAVGRDDVAAVLRVAKELMGVGAVAA